MSDPTEIRKLQTMAEETARQVKRQAVWDTNAIPGTNPANITTAVAYGAHGLVVGDIIESTASLTVMFSSWVKASIASTGPIGVVVSVEGVNNFTVGLWGQFFVSVSLFTPTGWPSVQTATFYLTTTAGTLTQSLSTLQTAGQQARPILVVLQNNGNGSKRQILIFGNELLGNRDSIQDLTDTALSSVTALTDGDLLTWKSATKNWINAPSAGLGSRAATSVFGRSAASAGAGADIAATADNQALVRIAGTLQWAALPVAAIANIAATTVLGNATAGSAAVTAIAAAADNTVLIRTAGALAFGTIPNAALQNSSVIISGTLPIQIGGSGALGGTTTVAVNDATTSAKGVVQLAGDLAGTAALPVIGVNKVDFTKFLQGAAYTTIVNATSATANFAAVAAADGQILQRVGTALGFVDLQVYTRTQTFNASTTFTVPAGVFRMFVLARGGGGGGGGMPAATFGNEVLASGGGGQGALGMGWINTTPGGSVTITIGIAGTGGTAAGGASTNGGTSSASATGTVSGGGGGGAPNGSASSNGAPGVGGTSATGIDGDNGGAPYPGSFGSSGTTLTTVTMFVGFGGGRGRGAGGDGTQSNGNGSAGTAGSVALIY